MDDSWNGLADLMTNLITKYAGILDIENLPDSEPVDEQNMNIDIEQKSLENPSKKCYNNHENTVQTYY